MNQVRKSGIDTIHRWIALACLSMALMLAMLEATHVHSSANFADNSRTPCVICVSVHARTQVVAVHALPPLSLIEIIPILDQQNDKKVDSKIKLYIRPPPSV